MPHCESIHVLYYKRLLLHVLMEITLAYYQQLTVFQRLNVVRRRLTGSEALSISYPPIFHEQTDHMLFATLIEGVLLERTPGHKRRFRAHDAGFNEECMLPDASWFEDISEQTPLTIGERSATSFVHVIEECLVHPSVNLTVQ